MKFLQFNILFLFILSSVFSQSKKAQIEALIFQKDSLNNLITSERISNFKKIDDLNFIISDLKDKTKSLVADIAVLNQKIDKTYLDLSMAKDLLSKRDSEIAQKNEEVVMLKKEIQHTLDSISHQQQKFTFDEVKIGSQIWMAENLNTDKFSNGEPVMQVSSDLEFNKASDAGNPAWCYYNYDPHNGEKYGKLYNYYVIKNSLNICPNGWHIPKSEELEILNDYLGREYAGYKMKSNIGWKINPGSNESGFNALPGGCRIYKFAGIGTDGTWWSSSDDQNGNSIFYYV
jgi:uncharacterized protein (TIGR02145 family)